MPLNPSFNLTRTTPSAMGSSGTTGPATTGRPSSAKTPMSCSATPGRSSRAAPSLTRAIYLLCCLWFYWCFFSLALVSSKGRGLQIVFLSFICSGLQTCCHYLKSGWFCLIQCLGKAVQISLVNLGINRWSNEKYLDGRPLGPWGTLTLTAWDGFGLQLTP